MSKKYFTLMFVAHFIFLSSPTFAGKKIKGPWVNLDGHSGSSVRAEMVGPRSKLTGQNGWIPGGSSTSEGSRNGTLSGSGVVPFGGDRRCVGGLLRAVTGGGGDATIKQTPEGFRLDMHTLAGNLGDDVTAEVSPNGRKMRMVYDDTATGALPVRLALDGLHETRTSGSNAARTAVRRLNQDRRSDRR